MFKATIITLTLILPLTANAHSKPVSKSDMPRLQQECSSGNGNSCQALGRVYRSKDDARKAGVRYNLETSLAYYQRGCDLGDTGACGSTNRIYANKSYKGYDPIRAYPYFQQRCAERGAGDSHCKVAKELARDLKKPKWRKKLEAIQSGS